MGLSSRLTASVALAWLLVTVGCRSAETLWGRSWSAEYGRFSPELREQFFEVRQRMEARDFEGAWRQLAPLVESHDDNLELAIQLQEIELKLIESGTDVDPELAALGGAADPEETLRKLYAERADRDATVVRLVLAARVESDALAALNLLDQALALDPGCAWAHYGRAHALLQLRNLQNRWSAVQEALAAALEADPSHLRGRRLQAWMLAQEGAVSEGAVALQTWLEQTRDDPRFSQEERREAELDLALLFILDGAPSKGRRLLEALEGEPVGRGRRLALLSVAEHALGDYVSALDAARRAEGALDDELLPVVQQAILYEYWLEDFEAADEEWCQIIERAKGRGDLAQVVQSFRARVILERREASKEQGRP